MKSDYSWPIDFDDGVPPNGVIQAQGYAYRLVRNNPPIETDFLPTRVEYPNRVFRTKEEEIMSYGVSVSRKKDTLLKIRARFPEPEQFGGTVIVGGEMVPDLGVTQALAEDNGHLTLWKQVSSQPHLYICNYDDEGN